MTLLSDVVRVLHDAEVAGYSVQSSVRTEPGDPDLVVNISQDDEADAAVALSRSQLPIAEVKRVRHGVLHVWQRPPSD